MMNTFKRAAAAVVLACTVSIGAMSGTAHAATACGYYDRYGTFQQYYSDSGEWYWDYGEQYCLTQSEYLSLINLRMTLAWYQTYYENNYGYSPSSGVIAYQMGLVDPSMSYFFDMLDPWTRTSR
jgi:hypothetical protein